jgi:hypothetical protein
MPHENSDRATATPFLMERRQFILTTAAGMAGLMALSPAKLFADAPADSSPLLSVGFWNAHLAPTRTGGVITSWSSLNVQAGREITSSDPTFLRAGAEVQVLGYWRPAARRAAPLSVTFDALFTNPAGGDKLPFFAWSYASAAGVESSAGPVRFRLPVGASDALDLRVTRRPPVTPVTATTSRRKVVTTAIGNTGTTRAEVTSFSINGLPDTQRLQRGVYFIAVRESASEALPDWSAVRVIDPDKDHIAVDLKTTGLLRQNGLLDSQEVPFSYLVVAINPAAEVMSRAARH